MKKSFLFLVSILLIICACCSSAETTVIRMTVGGDALLGSSEPVRTKLYESSFDYYIEQYGYSYPFANLVDLFSADDITLLNLQCPLVDEPAASAVKSRYCFRGLTDYAKVLSCSSVQIVNLANNHIMNHGQAGVDSTIQALEKEGIWYCGSVEEGSYSCIIEVKGYKLGFVGVLPLYYHVSAKTQADVKARFDELKEAGCDLIIASLHCGREYEAKHDDIHTKYEGICLKLGADLIIGTHPHVPQGINIKNGVTHIYSLGNSSFGGNTGVDEKLSVPESYLATFDLYFEDGVYTGHQMTIWPILITGAYPVNNYQPVFATGEAAEKVMKMIQRDTTFKLNPYVQGMGAVQEFVPATKKN